VRFYATVNAAAIGAPNLIAGRTLNFTAVSHPTVGSYCLTAAAGIRPGNGTASVSVDWAESFGNVLFAYSVDSYFAHNCPLKHLRGDHLRQHRQCDRQRRLYDRRSIVSPLVTASPPRISRSPR
jgi:hypothetical protein